MHVYPTVFVFAATLRSAVVVFDLLSSWSQAIRDKEFLVEMKLRNHEPELEKVHEKGKGVRNGENRIPPLEFAGEEAHNP
jgi:E3 ubiquitin-protein ligase MARCH6